jgi:hypothetical protein
MEYQLKIAAGIVALTEEWSWIQDQRKDVEHQHFSISPYRVISTEGGAFAAAVERPAGSFCLCLSGCQSERSERTCCLPFSPVRPRH